MTPKPQPWGKEDCCFMWNRKRQKMTHHLYPITKAKAVLAGRLRVFLLSLHYSAVQQRNSPMADNQGSLFKIQWPACTWTVPPWMLNRREPLFRWPKENLCSLFAIWSLVTPLSSGCKKGNLLFLPFQLSAFLQAWMVFIAKRHSSLLGLKCLDENAWALTRLLLSFPQSSAIWMSLGYSAPIVSIYGEGTR